MAKAIDPRPDRSAKISPLQWHDSFSAPPILSSDARWWAPGLLRQWSDTAPLMEQPVLDHHYVTMHLGGAKRVSRRGGGASVLADVDAGGLTIMPAGSSYTWRTEGPIGFVHLYLAPRILNQIVAEEFDRDSRKVSLIDRVGFSDPLLTHLLFSMLDELRLSGVPSRLLWDALLRTFALKLVRDHSTIGARLAPSRYELAPYRLRRVLAFIEARFTDDIGLADLAGIASSSVYHFSRGFRQATGLPPYRFVVERRIEHAKVLLRDSSLPLADVARQCGFKSQQQFGAMFAKFTGVGPGRFRREL